MMPYANSGLASTSKALICHITFPVVVFKASCCAPRNRGGAYSCPSQRNSTPPPPPMPVCTHIGQTPYGVLVPASPVIWVVLVYQLRAPVNAFRDQMSPPKPKRRKLSP